jgi:hypothetical protein
VPTVGDGVDTLGDALAADHARAEDAVAEHRDLDLGAAGVVVSA